MRILTDSLRHRGCTAVAALLLGGASATAPHGAGPSGGQDSASRSVQAIVVEPAEITLAIGESSRIEALAVAADGTTLPGVRIIYFSMDRQAVSIGPDGTVTAHRAGTHQVAAMAPRQFVAGEPADRTGRFDAGPRALVSIVVPAPALTRIDLHGLPERVFTGQALALRPRVLDAAGIARDEVRVDLRSDNAAVLGATGPTTFAGRAPGQARVVAEVEGLRVERTVEVVESPVAALTVQVGEATVRTGDVVRVATRAADATGAALAAYPIDLAMESWPDRGHPDALGAGAAAQLGPDGRFVAEQPGIYVVVATAGRLTARTTITVVPRRVDREVELLGRAPIRDRVTADLWVWEGIDGRDYAVVGTWNAEGHAYFYDVTDPSNMTLVDTVQVDARTVNDVKVSEDGRIAVISREGASNRRNGLVILDVSDAHAVGILSSFDDQLTGGVHNIFVHDEHVYAVNNGRRVDIINIEDPRDPHRVGRFETDTPGRSVHDVWVRDGIAYQAGRTDGLIVVDVGGGGMGGSPTTPVEMARVPQLTGWNHSAWPFTSPSTGKTYVIGGDEAFYRHPLAPESGGINWREKLPSRARGWLHFVDISDPAEPLETARYQVPESGPHNYWIDAERELLYIGHFDAGLRVVDISGDLLGDLYRQGREVARFYTDDGEGFIPNAPFVWGPQPHKGTIFLADFSSGLWAVRLRDERRVDDAPATASAFEVDDATPAETRPLVEPAAITMTAGESTRLRATDGDSGTPMMFFSRSPLAVSVTADGRVEAHSAGSYEIVALVPDDPTAPPDTLGIGDPGTRTVVAVTVLPSPLATLELTGLPGRLRVGDVVAVGARARDARGRMRDVRPTITAGADGFVQIAAHGGIFGGSANAHPFYRRERPDLVPGEAAALLSATAPGTVSIRARAGELETAATLVIEPHPAARVELTVPRQTARTGDVLPTHAAVYDAGGQAVEAQVRFALRSEPDPEQAGSRAAGAPAQVLPDGRFVAEQPGVYTIVATSGSARTQISIRVDERDVQRSIDFVGQGPVRDRVTSDLWVWEGNDGRDYAITGTWQSEGHAYFWDVTDPTAITRIAEIQVDARTVNDVKVSADGRIAVMTREGASNRRNGLVVLDVSDPRHPEILSRYDDQMTGGVHNVFIHDDHVYAINNGRRWDVINIEDPRNPFRVGRFETSVPGRSVHDVWVRNGIAYQAGNTEGVIVVDVGGGNAGGTPARPVEIGRLPQLTGWNHAIWPFYSRSAGKMYVIAGDESHPVNPRDPGNIISVDARLPSRAMGWLHVIELDDPSAPVEVARYRVPEAGPHNLWIDWDIEVMYVAYFNGGLRVVDLSGELVGDLYRQGREIAKFYSDDLQGYVPNAPFVWGPQPYKGTIFFSDFHSGLWAVRLGEPVRRP